jgi:predicted porin
MKKSVLALAVAAALAAPLATQADTILYGSARVSVDYNDESNSDDAYWDVFNNDSRLGVLGSEDLGGGLSAVYQYEFGIDVTEGTSGLEGNRPKFVGLKGNFGGITLGTQETPYYGVTGVTDIFNSGRTFGATSWLGGSFSGYRLNPGETRTASSGGGSLSRLDNSVMYTTPDFSGFSASVLLSMNGSLNDAQGWSDGVDIWNISAKYSNGPFFAGVTYIALDGDQITDEQGIPLADLDLDQWAIGLGYNAGAFSVGFMYEQGTYNEWGLLEPIWQIDLLRSTDTPWNAYLTASYTFGNNVISAAYGQMSTGVSGQDDMQNYLVGYQYNFSRRTRFWIEYIGRNADDNIFYGDQNAVSIGTRVDF